MTGLSERTAAKREKTFSIGLLALCEVAALALWFSASAVVPSILIDYSLTPTQVSLSPALSRAPPWVWPTGSIPGASS